MKAPRVPGRSVWIPLALALFAGNLAGCAKNNQARVVLLANRDVAALDADDIVRVMQRAGFSDQQILELGTELRNTFASSGAAKIQVRKKIEAIFAVNGRYLHASSRRRGSFIYDLEEHKFR